MSSSRISESLLQNFQFSTKVELYNKVVKNQHGSREHKWIKYYEKGRKKKYDKATHDTVPFRFLELAWLDSPFVEALLSSSLTVSCSGAVLDDFTPLLEPVPNRAVFICNTFHFILYFT